MYMIKNIPLTDLPKEEVNNNLINRPIRGLYDISYVYGKISILNDKSRMPENVDSKYTKYLTPSDSISSEFGEPNSLITVNFNWTGDNFEYTGISDYTIDWELSARAGYCRPGNKSSQKTVHSITKMTSGSGNDISKISEYLGNKMFSWFDSEIIECTSDSNMGWVLKELQDFGSDELVQKIKRDIETDLEGVSSITGLMSIKLTIDDSAYLPGEIEAFNDGMVYNKENRVKNSTDKMNGVCYITDKKGEVFGKAFGSPYNLYSSGMTSPYWNFDLDKSAKERPLSMDAIMTIMRGSEMIKKFNTSINSNSDRFAYIPYYTFVQFDEAVDLYKTYRKFVDGSDNLFNFIGDWLAHSDYDGDEDKLIYALLFNHKKNSLYIFNKEAKQVRESVFEKLNSYKEEYMREISEIRWLSDIVQLDYSEKRDESKIIYKRGDDKIFTTSILSGDFFRDTMGYDNPSWSVFNFVLTLLSGEQFTMDSIYDKYVSRIIEQQNYSLSEGHDSIIPTNVIWRQFLQLHILSSHGSVKSAKHLINLSDNKITMSEKEPKTRKERFNIFIKEHKGLETDEQISAFTLGALVGRLSAIQKYSLDLSQSLAGSHPVKSMSTNRFEQIVQEVIDKNQQYANSEDIKLYSYYTDVLVDKCLSSNRDEWEITTQELRYYYALGLAYGHSDTYIESKESTKKDEKSTFDEDEQIEL